MATHTHSKEAHQAAVNRYNAKVYKTVPIRLKKTEDKDILDDIENATKNGISHRQWVRTLFDNGKEK